MTPVKQWRLRSRTIHFERGPVVMGIVNVTPDSFSDGGLFFSSQSAIDHALKLEDSGAGILDIGGQSTRPYSDPVSESEELRRIVPILEALCQRVSIPISVDTTKSAVAQAAIGLGAEIINDISGLQEDPAMIPLASEMGVGVCVMHIQGTPKTMQDNPFYDNVVVDVHDCLRRRDEALRAAGVAAEKICLDPGIGCGKTHEHNLELLRGVQKFHDLGRPLLIGHSRKGFIGKLIGNQSGNRDAATLGISLALASQLVQVLRVHDVKATVEALAGFQACCR